VRRHDEDVESIFSHSGNDNNQHTSMLSVRMVVAKIESIWEVLKYPLMFMWLGTAPEQLLCAWTVFGVAGIFGYIAVALLPIGYGLYKV
jgi:Na+/melibiose symporter-like transporter